MESRWCPEQITGSFEFWDVALGTCVSPLEGHSNSVKSVGFSPDGKYVVSGSEDKTVRLWDVALGTCSSTLEGHGSSVTSVAFSANGKQMVSGSYSTIQIWDIASATCTLTLEGHRNEVRSVAFSLDGKQVVSGTTSLVRIWGVASGTCTSILQGHKELVTAVAFSLDGKLVVSASNDKTVRIWDVVSRTCTAILKGHNSPIRSVAFSPDGKHVASGSFDETVRIWDIASGTCTLSDKRQNQSIMPARLLDPTRNAALCFSSQFKPTNEDTAHNSDDHPPAMTTPPGILPLRADLPPDFIARLPPNILSKDLLLASDRWVLPLRSNEFDPNRPIDRDWEVQARWLGFISELNSFSRVCRLPARFGHVTSNIVTHENLVAIGTEDGIITVLDVSGLLR